MHNLRIDTFTACTVYIVTAVICLATAWACSSYAKFAHGMYQNKKLVAPTHCHKGAHHRSTQWPLFLKVRKNFRLINFFSKRRRWRWSFVGLCPLLLLLPYFYRPIRNTCYQFFRQIYFYSYQAQAGIQIREGRQRRALWNSPSGEQQCFSYTAACKISLAAQSIYF